MIIIEAFPALKFLTSVACINRVVIITDFLNVYENKSELLQEKFI